MHVLRGFLGFLRHRIGYHDLAFQTGLNKKDPIISESFYARNAYFTFLEGEIRAFRLSHLAIKAS